MVTKLAWFLCPTVALCQQQHAVISAVIPKVMVIIGSMEPERWSSQSIWRSVVSEHNAVVSTPQVLLDELSHSYLKLDTDIGLLIFDEAHHAVSDHPYNRIMQESYFKLKRPEDRPAILGLTASPVFGTDVQKGLECVFNK
jgi:endoribonuclease Dicer